MEAAVTEAVGRAAAQGLDRAAIASALGVPAPRRRRVLLALAVALVAVGAALTAQPAARGWAEVQARHGMLALQQWYDWTWIYHIDCLVYNPFHPSVRPNKNG